MGDELELEACWRDIRPRLKGGRACRARLLGAVFGRLKVVEAAGSDKHGATLWKCVCECGKEKIASRGALKSGRVKSCGCLLEEYKRSPKAHLNKPDFIHQGVAEDDRVVLQGDPGDEHQEVSYGRYARVGQGPQTWADATAPQGTSVEEALDRITRDL